jgi:hypothetical protein
VHQGQIITLWITSIYGEMQLDTKTGLLTECCSLNGVNFGVARLGNDVTTSIVDFGQQGPYAQFGVFQTPPPLWAGESPQYYGLDQINVAFPTCVSQTKATMEARYDAFMQYTNQSAGQTVRLYLPFLVRVGDPACPW